MWDCGLVRPVRKFLQIAFVACGVAGSATAGPIEDAVEARLRGDYAGALRLLRPLAAKGDPVAQSNLGFMYATGQGLPRNLTEAAKWYRSAAEQGRAAAQYN